MGTVLWDFDNTIAHRPGMWSGALAEAIRGLDPSTAVTVDLLRPSLQTRFPWHEFETGHPELNEPELWWAAVVPVFVDAYTAAGVEIGLAQAAAAETRSRFLDPLGWQLFAEVVPALDELTRAGFRQIIVSNHVPELRELVGALGLGNRFEAVLSSANIGFEKPHGKMFEAALDLCLEGEPVWMVGDNPIADIQGAAAVGIPGILVRRPDASGLMTDALGAARKIIGAPI